MSSPAIEALPSGSLPTVAILGLPGIRNLTQTFVPDWVSASTEFSEAGSTVEESAKSSLVYGKAPSEFINAPTRCSQTHSESGNVDSEDTQVQTTGVPLVPTLSANTRDINRDAFAENPPVHLPRGHPVVALSESQLNSLVYAVS